MVTLLPIYDNHITRVVPTWQADVYGVHTCTLHFSYGCWLCCSAVRVSQCDARGTAADVSVSWLRASGASCDGQQPDRHRHRRLCPAAHPRTRKSDNDDISMNSAPESRELRARSSTLSAKRRLISPCRCAASLKDSARGINRSHSEVRGHGVRFTETSRDTGWICRDSILA